MNRLIPGALMCCVASASALNQAMSPQQIEAAIEAGRSGKEGQLLSRCNATAGFLDRLFLGPGFHPEAEHFHVSVSLTPGRIAVLAAQSKRLYKQLLSAELPAHLRTQAVFVDADPHQPVSGFAVPPIEHVVLRSKNGLAVQPEELKTDRVEWSNPPGSAASPNRAAARFAVGGVRELPAGEFDVVLITPAGERTCKVGAKDRERLFLGR